MKICANATHHPADHSNNYYANNTIDVICSNCGVTLWKEIHYIGIGNGKFQSPKPLDCVEPNKWKYCPCCGETFKKHKKEKTND